MDNCANNMGEMSSSCKLELLEIKQNIKSEFTSEFEFISKEIDSLRNEIKDLKRNKADELALREVRDELIRFGERIESMAKNDEENKSAIDRLGEQISELFKIINEYNYENGEVIAKVENLSEQLLLVSNQSDKVLQKVNDIKIPTFPEQIDYWIDRGKSSWGKKIRKLMVYAIGISCIITLIAAMGYYTGQESINLKDLFDLIKGLIS